jgi:hypothetical protein
MRKIMANRRYQRDLHEEFAYSHLDLPEPLPDYNLDSVIMDLPELDLQVEFGPTIPLRFDTDKEDSSSWMDEFTEGIFEAELFSEPQTTSPSFAVPATPDSQSTNECFLMPETPQNQAASPYFSSYEAFENRYASSTSATEETSDMSKTFLQSKEVSGPKKRLFCTLLV